MGDMSGDMANPAGGDDTRFHVRAADWAREGALMRALRARVFVEEQGVPPEIEQDGRDPECLHVIAQSTGGTVIGTGRVLPSGQIGRMAVIPPWRGRGVGAALLHALVGLARERGLPPVFLHAQAGAIPFYERQGFRPVGDAFLEAGIRHRKMVLEQQAAESK